MTLAASRHSEDPGSKYKGGCYPNINRGQFVPEFEAAVFDTPIGDLSPVFETDFGYHFLRVTDRRGQVFSACHVLMSPKWTRWRWRKWAAKWTASCSASVRASWGLKQAVLEYSTREETKNQGGLVVNPRDGGTLFGSDEIDPNLFSSSTPSNLANPPTPSNSPMTTIKATGLRCSWKSASRRTERTQRRILGTSKPSSKTVCAKNR